MKPEKIAIALSLVGAALLGGCEDDASSYKKISPAKVEQIKDKGSKRITLTPEAIKRIDLQTAVVRETKVQGSGQSLVARKIVPYGSLIYDEFGKTWVYTRADQQSFEREPVEVDYIQGADVVLIHGPPKEAEVATSGAAELYGVEGGIGAGKK